MLDGFSWPYAFAIGTLLLAVVLTDIARAQESDWSAWTASLCLTALGLMAVLAGNPLTLILAWAALDFAELLVMFWHVHTREGRRRVALTVSAKVISLFLLLWAWIVAGRAGIKRHLWMICPSRRASTCSWLHGSVSVLRQSICPKCKSNLYNAAWVRFCG